MIRLFLLDQKEEYIGAITNYFDAKLNLILEGWASMLEVNIFRDDPVSSKISLGQKITFKYQDELFTMNITSIKYENNLTISIVAKSSNLELSNELRGNFETDQFLTFEQYLNFFDNEHVLTVGKNEISDRELMLSFSEQTLQARLIDMAQKFECEFEIIPNLTWDLKTQSYTLNLYDKRDSHGIGLYQPNIKLRQGIEVDEFSLEMNTDDLFTAVCPIGSDGLNLIDYSMKWYTRDGVLEYFTFDGSGWIYASIARDQFPSTIVTSNSEDRYIGKKIEFETKDQGTLVQLGLKELKELSQPTVTVDVNGYADLKRGDIVTYENNLYDPKFVTQLRVIEQTIDLNIESNSRTTFSNEKIYQIGG